MIAERSCMHYIHLTSFDLEGHICIECGAHLNVDEITARNDCRKWTKKIEYRDRR